MDVEGEVSLQWLAEGVAAEKKRLDEHNDLQRELEVLLIPFNPLQPVVLLAFFNLKYLLCSSSSILLF